MDSTGGIPRDNSGRRVTGSGTEGMLDSAEAARGTDHDVAVVGTHHDDVIGVGEEEVELQGTARQVEDQLTTRAIGIHLETAGILFSPDGRPVDAGRDTER